VGGSEVVKYDSKFEKELHETVLNKCEFHKGTYPYYIYHEYEPDFVIGKILIETKGRFRTSAEARKYKAIREYLPKGWELVFVFQNHNTPFPHAKRRKKCGTKMTHGEWATKNGFTWYTPRTVPKEWSKKR
jgi:hypothetical protein